MERVTSNLWLDGFSNLTPEQRQVIKGACERWYSLGEETDSGGWYKFDGKTSFQFERDDKTGIVYLRTYGAAGVGRGYLGTAHGEHGGYRVAREMPEYEEVAELLTPVYYVDELEKTKNVRKLLGELSF